VRYAERLRETKPWRASSSNGSAALTAQERSLLRKAHQTLHHVTEDMEERWHFNTDVALCMELGNVIADSESEIESGSIRAGVLKESLEILVQILAVFVPHLADELWEALGHKGSTLQAEWPSFDPHLAAEEELEIPVQVNGKLRARLSVSASAHDDEIRQRALDEPKVREHINGRHVVKVVVVPKKLVNIVVK
jgi:leucyl-tRNA synthetase